MSQILRSAYQEIPVASILGFKGGTCAHLFYELPRFSVDLDFDMLSTDAKDGRLVFETLERILAAYGVVKDKRIKRQTIFFLLSYGTADRNIKVEVSTRNVSLYLRDFYELRHYLGIAMLAARKDYLFASKLVALTSRKTVAMRDVYDIYFFAKNRWDLNGDVIKVRTGGTIKQQLTASLKTIERIKKNQVLQGLGDLLEEKEKLWVKQKLIMETVFLLKNYMAAAS